MYVEDTAIGKHSSLAIVETGCNSQHAINDILMQFVYLNDRVGNHGVCIMKISFRKILLKVVCIVCVTSGVSHQKHLRKVDVMSN